jgi:hypothetical protein
MANEPASVDMKDVWQSQAGEPIKMSSAELRQRSQKLNKKVVRRNIREYLAAAVVVVLFGYYFWRSPDLLLRLGSFLTIAGALYYGYQLHARGSARIMPPEMARETCLEFHRKELERQRDLVRTVWSWAILPIVPGVIIFMLGGALGGAIPGHVGHTLAIFGIRLAIVFGVFFTVWKLNQRAAKRLQVKIDTLTALQKESQ